MGAAVLSRALQRVAEEDQGDVLIGLDAPDDAAVVDMRGPQVLIHTVDFFPAMVDDPYLFGRIAAESCARRGFVQAID